MDLMKPLKPLHFLQAMRLCHVFWKLASAEEVIVLLLKADQANMSFLVHDADYRASKKDWDTFVESLTEKIIEKDDTIPELPAKDLVGLKRCLFYLLQTRLIVCSQ